MTSSEEPFCFMKNQLLKLAFEVEIEEGEQLNLPSSIVQGIGKGKWVITMA